MSRRLVIIGGGPGGNTAATVAATLGAEVTLVERDVIGGAAHLWDCIPSKAMIATGGELVGLDRAATMGLAASGELDVAALRHRVHAIEEQLRTSVRALLESQGVRLVRGTAHFVDSHTVAVESDTGTTEVSGDVFVVATGSRPRVPDWVSLDGERVLTTREAYPPPEIPSHLCVIGSGVTGVEFTHMFSALGSEVTLVVSRQQVLPLKDAEVAAVLEDEFLGRGVHLLKGARATGVTRTDDGVHVACDDGRHVDASHVILAIGSVPNTEGLALDVAGVATDGGYITINHNCITTAPHIYAAGDVSGKLPLSSVAAMQGRKIAEHLMGLHALEHRHLDYEKAASAIFTEPEIADVGLAEADAFSSGRKIRVTKVPFATNPKALINGDPRGFVKIISDPATGVVLGGSIVGRSAAELISVIAVAVTNNLRVADIVDSLLVHPAMAESLIDARVLIRMAASHRPALVVVSGPPGTGKTTLAHALARAIGCPAVIRDEIKEGMIVGRPRFRATPADDESIRTRDAFFASLRLFAERGVTVVAEAAFQHHVWVPNLEPVRSIAEVRVVQCHARAEVVRARLVERGGARRAHADDALLDAIARGEDPSADFRRVEIDAPTIDVDTTDGYVPSIDAVVAGLGLGGR